MKNETIKKINKLGKAGYIICKIGRIIMLVAAVFCLVGAVLMCFIPKNAIKLELITTNSAILHLDEKFDLSAITDSDLSNGMIKIGDNAYKLMLNDKGEPSVINTMFYLSNIKWILFAAVFALACAYTALYFAGKLCLYFKNCDTPFSKEISAGLIRFAWSLVPVCVVNSLMNSSVNSLTSGKFELNISLDLTTLLLILCVLMLSYIFKYGAVLQAESDETL